MRGHKPEFKVIHINAGSYASMQDYVYEYKGLHMKLILNIMSHYLIRKFLFYHFRKEKVIDCWNRILRKEVVLV